MGAMRGSNDKLCAVVKEAAFMVAALVCPMTGLKLATLPPHVQEVDGVLLGQLQGVGLMDAYALADGGFGI